MSPRFIIFHGEALEIWDELGDPRNSPFKICPIRWVGVCCSDLKKLGRSEKNSDPKNMCWWRKSKKSITSITPNWSNLDGAGASEQIINSFG